MKAGIRTSEFWVAVIMGVLSEFNVLYGSDIDVERQAILWAAPIAYIISRGLSKMGGKS